MTKDLTRAEVALVDEAREELRLGRAEKALELLDIALCRPDPRQCKKYDEWKLNFRRSAPPLIPDMREA